MRPLARVVVTLILASCPAPSTAPRQDRCDDGRAPRRFHVDRDGDGYGDQRDPGTLACLPPPGRVPVAGDCADDDPSRHPTVPELCNDIDEDCFAGNDITVGDLTVNGTLATDVQASLRIAEGRVRVGLCGGVHRFTLAPSDLATSVEIVGEHPSVPSVAHGLTDEQGAPVVWSVRDGTDLVVRDVSLGEVQLDVDSAEGDLSLERVRLSDSLTRLSWRTAQGRVYVRDVTGAEGPGLWLAGALDVADVDVRSLELTGPGRAERLRAVDARIVQPEGSAPGELVVEDVEIAGVGLSVLGDPIVQRALIRGDRFQAAAEAELLLDEVVLLVDAVDLVSLSGDAPFRVSGLYSRGATVARVEVPDGVTVTLDRPTIAQGGGLQVAGAGTLVLEGGSLIDNDTAVRLTDEGALRLRGIALLRNRRADPAGAVLDGPRARFVELVDVTVGEDNDAPLIRVGDQLWDGTGRLDVRCEPTGCVP